MLCVFWSECALEIGFNLHKLLRCYAVCVWGVCVCILCCWQSGAACLSAVSVSPCWQVYLKSCCLLKSPPNTVTSAFKPQREKQHAVHIKPAACLPAVAHIIQVDNFPPNSILPPYSYSFLSTAQFMVCIWDWIWNTGVMCLTQGPWRPAAVVVPQFIYLFIISFRFQQLRWKSTINDILHYKYCYLTANIKKSLFVHCLP